MTASWTPEELQSIDSAVEPPFALASADAAWHSDVLVEVGHVRERMSVLIRDRRKTDRSRHHDSSQRTSTVAPGVEVSPA